jgi:DNA repair exonuclease SbcCD ATPase subunit
VAQSPWLNLSRSLQALDETKADVTAAKAVIATLATAECDLLKSDIEGLRAVCDDLEARKANAEDLQEASKHVAELQLGAQAMSDQLQELRAEASELHCSMEQHATQLENHAAGFEAVKGELSMKANQDAFESLQGDIVQIQQDSEALATLEQLQVVAEQVQQLHGRLQGTLTRLDETDVTAEADKRHVAAELNALKEAQAAQHSALDGKMAALDTRLEDLQGVVDRKTVEDGEKVCQHGCITRSIRECNLETQENSAISQNTGQEFNALWHRSKKIWHSRNLCDQDMAACVAPAHRRRHISHKKDAAALIAGDIHPRTARGISGGIR